LKREVGCDSKYSDEKKKDVFESKYKNKWMTWGGEIVLVSSDSVSIKTVPAHFTQDLQVSFSNKSEGYSLQKGDKVNVKFVMKTAGGCILPFSGEEGSLVK
jgi:hypothetical protein